MKIIIISILIYLLSIITYGSSVIIDPGHGGVDTGAKAYIYKKNTKNKKIKQIIYEKEISLLYAKKLKDYLLKKNFTVYLTRSFDHKVDLEKRAELAGKVKADIFISIHMNASTKKRSVGFETYYLDNHKHVGQKKLEEVENRGLRGDQLIIGQIIADLIVERTVTSSKNLGKFVHNSIASLIKKQFSMKDRGLKPGVFYVLALSKRPALLIEIGFISNPKELTKILNPKFQNAYIKALGDGIIEYLKKK